VIRQGGRQGSRLVLAIFKKSILKLLALFYALYLGLVTSKQFNKGTFRRVIGCFSG